MVLDSAVVHQVALSKFVMLPVVHVFVSCHRLRFIHAIKTQAVKIRSRFALRNLQNSLVVTAARAASILFGLKGEIVEPLEDGLHGGSLTYTLERPNLDIIERFLVAKERHLFATAVCPEQTLIWPEQLVVNHCSKPSFCGVELFRDAALIQRIRLNSYDGLTDYTALKPQVVVDRRIVFGDMANRIVGQEARDSHKAFRVIEYPTWIE